MLPFVLCLGGPTGSGKTALAIKAAKIFGCEIINADSRQLYKDFPIITAQPEQGEREGIPHHLYGVLTIAKKISVADWIRDAASAIREISQKGKIPLLVGGTGFYIRAIFEGLSEIPEIKAEVSQEIRERLEKEKSLPLYLELCKVDPETARRLHPHDSQRITRGLEVFYSTGKPLYWWQKFTKKKPACHGQVYWLQKALPALEPVLLNRIVKMLEMGAVQEVERAMGMGPDMYCPGWESLGARELAAYIQGRISREECIKRWYDLTRAYAKRQLTWFRGQKKWLPVNNEEEFFLKMAENIQREARL